MQLLIKFAAIPVVELPVKGSKIQAFGFVDASIILVRTETVCAKKSIRKRRFFI